MSKILIVDNDKNTAETMSMAIATTGKFETEVVHSGQEALDRLKSNGYSLVLLDLMMPGVSGIDVCKEMVKDKKMSQIPVLIVSALPVKSKAFRDSQDKFNELNVIKGVVEKPFEVKDLLHKVDDVLGQG